MLGASADELLRSTSIPELRELCRKLEKDASSKQKDLQLMVGSRYRDFIQSTDAIAFMSDKAAATNETLSTFWSRGQELINRAQDLYATATQSSHNNDDITAILAVPVHQIDLYSVNSTKVWNYLSECNVHDAAVLCIVSQTILHHKSECIPSGLALPLFDSIQPAFKAELQASMALSAEQLADMKSAAFLCETVVGDAQMLLQASCVSADLKLTVQEKADALAVVSVLSILTDAEIMKLYLDLFKQAIETLELSVAFLKEANEASFVTTSSILNETVRLLQSAILDAHTMFFREVSVDVGGVVVLCNGLIASSRARVVQASMSVVSDTNASTKRVSRDPATVFDMQGYLSTTSSQSVSKLKDMFNDWLDAALPAIHGICDDILQLMDSIADVAQMQRVVWFRSCNTREASDEAASDEQEQQKHWEDASNEFLQASKKKRFGVSAQPKEQLRGGTLLWNSVFKVPFAKHMEKLMEEACEDVQQRVKTRVLLALAAEGVSVDSLSLVVTKVAASATGSTNVGSVRVYALAESIRELLEREVLHLLRDATLPDNDRLSDAQSNQNLQRALYIHFAQLLGHIVVFLRHIALSCQTARKDLQGNGSTLQDSSASLCCAALIVGRIAWLLKIDGRFIDEALLMSSRTGVVTTLSSKRDLVSEDQLLSAFEIADTNGDGIVTLAEAAEALQALSLESLRLDDPGTSYSFLKHVPNATLTFPEFALLSASILPEPSVPRAPILRLLSSLDLVIATAHTCWANVIVSVIVVGFKESLANDLSVSAVTTSSATPPSFKNTWKQKKVYLDDEDTASDRYSEVISYPSTTSVSLSCLFYKAVSALNTSVVSADTLRPIPDDFISNFHDKPETAFIPSTSGSRHPPVLSLTAFASNALFSAFGVAVLSAYDQLQTETNKASERLTVLAASKYKEYTVQVVFDILVSETLLKKFTNLPTVAYADVSADWKDRLDPVDYALMAPLLVESMNEYILKSKFLLPGLNSTVKLTTTPYTVVKDDSNKYDSTDGVFGRTAPRFTLLPLALHTTAPKSRQIQKDGSKDRDASKDEKSVGIINPFEISKAFGDLKTNIGGLTNNFGSNLGTLGNLSDNIFRAGEISASIGTSIGSFLKAGTSEPVAK